MKKVKKCLVAIVIMTTFMMVGFKNVDAISVDFGMHNMKYNEWQYYPVNENEHKTKTTNWTNQSLNIVRASTAMTDPCPDCTFAARLNRKDEQTSSTGEIKYSSSVLGSTIKMGQTGEFLGAHASVSGEFKIQVERCDFTLLKTMIRAIWDLG